ncbi:hypothetical protein Tco_1060523 [Tanacetum coccineum]
MTKVMVVSPLHLVLSALNTSVSNPFEVLNVVGKDAYDSSVQQPKGSDHVELEEESDEDEVYMPYGGGGMDGLEDDLDCYDGYKTQVYDLMPQEQAFWYQYDIRLNSRGRK